METLEDVDFAFAAEVPLGALVKLVLKRGLDVTYDEKTKVISIREAGREKAFGSPQHELTGRFKEYSDWGASGNGTLEFRTDRGYFFTLNCICVDNYEVLEP